MNNGDRAKWFLMDQLKWATLVTHSGSLYDVASWPLKDSFSTRQGWQKSLNNKTGTHKLSPRKFQGRKDGLFSTCRESAAPLIKIIYVYLKLRLVLLPNPGESKKIYLFPIFTQTTLAMTTEPPHPTWKKRRLLGVAWPPHFFKPSWRNENSARPAARAAALNQCLASVRAQWTGPGPPHCPGLVPCTQQVRPWVWAWWWSAEAEDIIYHVLN